MPRRKRRRDGPTEGGSRTTGDAAAPPSLRPPAWAADLALAILVAGATLLAFRGVADHGFLNWDDPDALVKNEALGSPGLVSWAFATNHMSHYQPLSWMAWGATRLAFGPEAAAYHRLSLAGHALLAVLLFTLARLVFLRVLAGPPGQVRMAAVATALAYALHPLRVEVVAWASAFPYVLAQLLLLLSFLMHWRASPETGPSESRVHPRVRSALLAVSFVTYAASLLARPVALAYPAVLLLVDRALGRAWRASLLEKIPFAILAVLFAAAEGSARAFVGLERTGLLPRLTLAAAAPFAYLGRLLWPSSLSPLDTLPLEARTEWPVMIGGLLALAAAAVVAVRLAPHHPWPVAAASAWLLLLAPAAGLLPSGLAATADRYTYLPDAALSLLVGGAMALLWTRSREAALVGTAVLAVALGASSARQATHWRDSVSLWTRAVALDPRNDVALYNLGLALAEAGDPQAAAEALRRTLALVPGHGPAREALSAIETRGLEAEAGRAADAGRLDEAIDLYGRVLAGDGARMRARSSRGMALVQRGRFEEAIADLTEARRLGNRESAVASALALALGERGREAECRDVLEAALRESPNDPILAHNLARVLASASDPAVRDPGRAVTLALAAERLTEGRDPRVYDTLAAAYAAAGQRDRAREAARRGLELARGQAEASVVDALAARLRALK